MVLGIFDFVYNILYSLTRVLLRVIDFICQAVNKISGIDTVTVNGKDTTFLVYLVRSSNVTYAFCIAAIIGIMLIFIFSIIAIVMTMAKENSEDTPQKVVKRAFKNFMILLCVPTFMLVFMYLTNEIVIAMYKATMCGSSSLAQYMFGIFGESCLKDGYDFSVFTDEVVKYSDSCGTIRNYLNLNDYDFFYSYLIGGIVVYLLLTTAMMLVERAISIVFLYIVSPFVVASAVVDEGARFKQWRDQVMVKFLTGQGAIIAINVYLMVVQLVISSDLEFFPDSDMLDSFVKLLFVVGGALSLKSVQAIVGNLISAGAGDKAMAENDRATHAMAGFASGALHAATSPFRGARSLYNFGQDVKQKGFGNTVKQRLGLRNEWDQRKESAFMNAGGTGGGSGNKFNGIPQNSGTNMANIMAGDDKKNENNRNDGNQNDKKNDNNKNNQLNNIIAGNNAGGGGGGDGGIPAK